MQVFRTATGRSCAFDLSPFTTWDALLVALAHAFSLTVPSVKLFVHAQRITSLDAVKALTGETPQSSAGGCSPSSILVIGCKVPVDTMASRTPSDSAKSPALNTSFSHNVADMQTGRELVPAPPLLRFPHVPGGLLEIQRIIQSHSPVSPQAALFESLRRHPTISTMSEMMLCAEGAADAENIMRTLLLQIQDTCPPIIDWIKGNASMFLHLMNGAEHLFGAEALMSLLWQNVVGDVLEALGVSEGGHTLAEDATVEVSDGLGNNAVFVLHSDGRHTDAAFTVTAEVSAPPFYEAGAVSDEQHARAALSHDEAIAQLESTLAMVDDIVMQASLMRELAAAYEMKVKSLDPGVCDSALLLLSENKASFYHRKAVSLLLRAVRQVDARDTELLQTICVVAPVAFVAAQTWFQVRDPMSSLSAHLAHLAFWDSVDKHAQQHAASADESGAVWPNGDAATDDGTSSVVYSHPGTARASLTEESSMCTSVDSALDPFQEAMRLMRYTVNHSCTLVLYSLLGPETMLTYVLRGGNNVRVVQTPSVFDGFKGSLTFVEEALQKRRYGVNLNLLWTERLSEMYRALVLPIADLLPPRPTEVEDPVAGQVCFVVSFSPVPLPFCAMLDENGVPCIAKWAIFQAHNPADLFAAESNEFAPTAQSVILSDAQPAWLSRHLARCLNAHMSLPPTLGPTPPHHVSTILHIDSIEAHSPQALPSCDFFVCEKFAPNLRYAIRRAALVRGMMIHESDGAMLPYEFSRSLYLTLCEGHSIARSLRMAMVATLRAYPLEPWRWGSMALFNYGGNLPRLDQHVESVAVAQQKRDAQSQRSLRAASSTAEARYSEYLGINTIYDTMLQALLREKPTTMDAIEDCMIATLETFPHDFRSTRPSSTTTSAGRSSTVKMAPTPPERPHGKARPAGSNGMHNGMLSSSNVSGGEGSGASV